MTLRWFLIAFFSCASAFATETYPSLQVGDDIYHGVTVLSANSSTLSIRHARGIAQVPLAKLSPELQQKYNYDPVRAAQRDAALREQRSAQAAASQGLLEARIKRAKAEQEAFARQQAARAPASPSQSVAVARSQFGTTPQLRQQVDLRPQFSKLGIGIREQAGPSCAVHSIIAALEYQYAQYSGKNLDLSEPFVVAATSNLSNRFEADELDKTTGFPPGWDAGFTLEQVFEAINREGVALQQSATAIRDGRKPQTMKYVNFNAVRIPGVGSEQGIGNLIHMLNYNMPVVVGVAWPHYSQIRSGVLSNQKPSAGMGHAVTIVGYRSDGKNWNSVQFVFRNSWGERWGKEGYGLFTMNYLTRHLGSAYVVELK